MCARGESSKDGVVCALLARDLQAGGHRTNPGDWLRLRKAMFARGQSSLVGVHEVHFGEAPTSDAEVAREKKGAVCALLAHDLKPGSRLGRSRTDPGRLGLSKALWMSGKGRFLDIQRDGIGGRSVLEVAREKERAVYAHPARDSKSSSY